MKNMWICIVHIANYNQPPKNWCQFPSTFLLPFQIVSSMWSSTNMSFILTDLVPYRAISRTSTKEVTTLFNVDTEIVSPPSLIVVNGDYIFITKIDEQWVPKELTKNPDAFMQYLQKQLEDGTIEQHIGSAFNQWYLYDNAQVLSSSPASMFLNSPLDI